jgi:hypothetical protein
MTREQVIAIFGTALVVELDKENCDFTGRLQTDGDTSVEFSANLRGTAADDGEERTLTAYYYQDKKAIAYVDDLDQLDWNIEGYEVG